MVLNTIEELIEDIRQGKMVILMDDEDRENEGDLVMAAPMVRAQDVFCPALGCGHLTLPGFPGNRAKCSTVVEYAMY